jgi:hypothetical protein
MKKFLSDVTVPVETVATALELVDKALRGFLASRGPIFQGELAAYDEAINQLVATAQAEGRHDGGEDAARWAWFRSKGYGFSYDTDQCGMSVSRWGKLWDEIDGDSAVDHLRRIDEQHPRLMEPRF